MKTGKFTGAIAAVVTASVVLTPLAAFAQDGDHRDDHRDTRHDAQQVRHDIQRDNRDQHQIDADKARLARDRNNARDDHRDTSHDRQDLRRDGRDDHRDNVQYSRDGRYDRGDARFDSRDSQYNRGNDRWQDRVQAVEQANDHRQNTKNSWRNLGLVSAAAAVYGVLRHDPVVTFAGAAGALYSAERYEQDRRSQSQNDRARAYLFDEGRFDRDGQHFERHETWQNGHHYYYFAH